jgi:hypothetical protein
MPALLSIICRQTFKAISNTIEIDIVVVVVEEHDAQPGVERVDRHNEQQAHDPFLLVFHIVVLQMRKNLDLNFKTKKLKEHL